MLHPAKAVNHQQVGSCLIGRPQQSSSEYKAMFAGHRFDLSFNCGKALSDLFVRFLASSHVDQNKHATSLETQLMADHELKCPVAKGLLFGLVEFHGEPFQEKRAALRATGEVGLSFIVQNNGVGMMRPLVGTPGPVCPATKPTHNLNRSYPCHNASSPPGSCQAPCFGEAQGMAGSS